MESVTVDDGLFDKGLKKRRETLGREYVDKNLNSADSLTRPFQESMTAWCWGFGCGWVTASAAVRAMAGCTPNCWWCCWRWLITTCALACSKILWLSATRAAMSGGAGSTSCRCSCWWRRWCWYRCWHWWFGWFRCGDFKVYFFLYINI